jgi:hypothetical protein
MSALKVDMRNLVYKLCEGREVPLLVTDMIAELLVHRDLFNINTLSRTLNAQANAIIYRDVVVDLDGTKRSVEKASLLFRTLLTSKTAARAVNSLSLAGDPLQNWRTSLGSVDRGESIENPLQGRNPPAMHADLTDFTREEIMFYGHVASLSSMSKGPRTNVLSIWAVWLYIFRLMPNIQDFSVSSDYFRWPGFRSILQAMVWNSSIAKLRSCSLCLDLLSGKRRHPVVVEDWDSALLSLLGVPGIQSITVVAGVRAEAVRQLSLGSTSITRLDLHHYQTHEVDLGSLLAAMPGLKYLKYHARSDYSWLGSSHRFDSIWVHDIGLEPLYDALHHVSDSLEELHLSQDVDEDSCHWAMGIGLGYEPLYRRTAALSSLKRLQALTIPYAALLGCKENSYVYDWNELLPSSLRRIVFNDDLVEDHVRDERTDEDLMPIFLTLVEWLSITKRGNETAQFGLHLAQTYREFNEPVRQELTRICEERGVQCSIEKVHADLEKRPQVWNLRGRGRGNLTRGRGRGRGT